MTDTNDILRGIMKAACLALAISAPLYDANQAHGQIQDVREISRMLNASTVLIWVNGLDGSSRIGSGFFIDADGSVITNRHVVSGAAEAWVVPYGARRGYEVRRVSHLGRNGQIDLARLDTATPQAVARQIIPGREIPENK